MASILVSRHLKTTEDLHNSRPSPRTESLVASAVQWAERIMSSIDGGFSGPDDKRWPVLSRSKEAVKEDREDN